MPTLQEQLAVARKGFAYLEAALDTHSDALSAGAPAPHNRTESHSSDDDLPDPNSLPDAASRDMLLSQLVTWDPAAPDAPTPANVLKQFREVDRPLAPLAAQMDTQPGLAEDNSLLWVRCLCALCAIDFCVPSCEQLVYRQC